MVKARANVTDGELKPGVDKGISDTAVDVARATSIQDRATRPDEVGFGVGILSQMVRAGETVPPWWSFSRDMELRRFWKQSDHLSGAMYVTNGKIATMNWKIRPKDRTIGAQTRMAGEAEQLLWETPEFGAGWEMFITKWLEDTQASDNGGFAEIIGAGNPEGPIIGRPVSLAHLDSTRCYRTSNPLYPVIYRDEYGKRYKLHYTRVLYASLMPSSDSRMNGVGFSSISRCLNTAQNLIDIGRYKQEKLGSRPARILLVGKKGITAEEILTAFMRTEEMDDSRGLSRYRSMVAIAPEDRRGEIEFEKIELSGVPDGFDEAQSTTLGMFTIALGFGVDARELWPASVTGASKADAMIQHLKARGRGPGQIMQIIERQINQKFLPPTLEFSFDLQDDEQDALQADVRDKRSIRNERDVKVGTVSVRVVREIMLDAGDLTDSQFEQLELEDGRLEDGTDAVSLFFSPDRDIKTLLTIPGLSDPFAFSAPRQPQMDEMGNVVDGEKDGAVESIDAAILKANEGLLRASGVAQKRKARQAIAALKRLRKLWTGEATLADDDTYVPPVGATPPGQPGPKPTQTAADQQRIRNEDDYDGENANQVVEDIA